MSAWRQLVRGLRSLVHRDTADRDVADEVQHYLEQATAAHLARGLPPDAALRAARLEMGSTTGVREEVRASGWEHAIETLLADLRYAARRLRSAPGFTAIAVLTLAVGIGATTAIFSAVNPILFQPPPYPDPGRIVMVWETFNAGGRQEGTFGMYAELRERARSFEAIAVLRPWEPPMPGPAEPERIAGQRVSASYFHVLGISPVLGRDFDPAEDRFGGARVVIVGDALWRRRFGADSAIIGRPIVLDGDQWTVVGGMAPGLQKAAGPRGRPVGAAAVRPHRVLVGAPPAHRRAPQAGHRARAGLARSRRAGPGPGQAAHRLLRTPRGVRRPCPPGRPPPWRPAGPPRHPRRRDPGAGHRLRERDQSAARPRRPAPR